MSFSLNSGAPVASWDPFLGLQKKRLLQQNAPNYLLLPNWSKQAPTLPEKLTELRERWRAVLVLECVPSVMNGALGETAEKATAYYEILWTMQLEQKWFARLDGSERVLPRRSPEVDLFRFLRG